MDTSHPFPASSVINLLDHLRSALTPVELLVLVGQLTVWMQGPTGALALKRITTLGVADGHISERGLEQLVHQLPLGRRTVELAFTRERVRYERIEGATWRMLAFELHHSITVAPQDLADALVRWWQEAAGTGDDFSPAPEIASTMLALSAPAPGEHVYCLGEAAEFISIDCMRKGFVPHAVSRRPPLVALLYSLLTGAAMELVPHDPLSTTAAEYFLEHGRKVTLAIPAMGMKVTDFDAQHWRPSAFGLRTSEAFAVERVAQIAATRAVILVPNGVLFRTGAEQRLRQHLVDSGHIRAVVSFPPGLLSSTSMPFSLLVLDTAQFFPDVVFYSVDAERDIKTSPGMLKHRSRQFTGERELLDAVTNNQPSAGRKISHDAIQRSDYTFSVNRYLATGDTSGASPSRDDREIILFEEIATMIKPQALRSPNPDEGITISEVSPAELPTFDFLTIGARKRLIHPTDRQRYAQQRLLPDDVLLSTKGTIGRTGIARPDPAAPEVFPSQSILVLRLNPQSPIRDPIVLMMYLRSPYFQAQLRSLVVGTTIPNVALPPLRSLPVRVPTLAEQSELRRTFETQRDLQRQIDALKSQQDLTDTSAWTATRLTVEAKHNTSTNKIPSRSGRHDAGT